MQRSQCVAPLVFVMGVAAISICRPQPLKAQLRDAVVERAKRVVVMIDAKYSGGEGAISNFGAGVVVGASMGRIYIVTANHVIRRGADVADDVRVTFRDLPGEAFTARVLPFHDPRLDYAVIAVTDGQTNRIVPNLPFRILRNTVLSAGLPVFHVGQPNQSEWGLNVTQAAIARFTGSNVFFQSPSLTVGYSGGGLFDDGGNLIGIVTLDASTDAYAVRIEHVLTTLRDEAIPINLSSSPLGSVADSPEQVHGPQQYVTDDDRCALGEPAESLRRELLIPRYVKYFYVFLRGLGPIETAESERLAGGMEKDEFIKCFEAFRETARARSMRLIITATDAGHRNWYQPEIKFRGQNLHPVRYRFPYEQRTEEGAEVPLN
jgi:hypothetical protein